MSVLLLLNIILLPTRENRFCTNLFFSLFDQFVLIIMSNLPIKSTKLSISHCYEMVSYLFCDLYQGIFVCVFFFKELNKPSLIELKSDLLTV